MTFEMTPEEVTKKYGKLFCKGFFTLVDEKNGKALIIEECSAKGPVEWDMCNRKRAGGALEHIKVEGTTLIMDTIIGEREVHFGPASKDLGGQGLKALIVDGDTVKTTWVGLAGASVGIGACLPQAPQAIITTYPDDPKIGGAHRLEVTISTPKMSRVIYAVDDTDTKEKGASWSMMLTMARSAPVGHLLEHKIVQLNPNVPEKTTNCVACAVSFAIMDDEIQVLDEYIRKYLKEHTLSNNTTMAVFRGLVVPNDLQQYGLSAKTKILKVIEAREAASRNNVEIVEITGERGAIGAVAAIGCFDLGPLAAGLPEDELARQ